MQKQKYAHSALRKAIAVDFDGCLFTDKYPSIGEPIQAVISAAKREQENGAGIILWTCRVGKLLEDAIQACSEQGITFNAINDSLPEWKAFYGNNPRKIGATEYWDDKAVCMDKSFTG